MPMPERVTAFFQGNTPGGLKYLMTEPLKIRGFAKLKWESISDYGGEVKEMLPEC